MYLFGYNEDIRENLTVYSIGEETGLHRLMKYLRREYHKRVIITNHSQLPPTQKQILVHLANTRQAGTGRQVLALI
jgi:hypothetical protein